MNNLPSYKTRFCNRAAAIREKRLKYSCGKALAPGNPSVFGGFLFDNATVERLA
jgi:hypothetical protein